MREQKCHKLNPPCPAVSHISRSTFLNSKHTVFIEKATAHGTWDGTIDSSKKQKQTKTKTNKQTNKQTNTKNKKEILSIAAVLMINATNTGNQKWAIFPYTYHQW